MQKQRPKMIVVAGQTPPPVGGQAVMIARLLDELSGREHIHSAHLAFRFTRDWQQARRAGIRKAGELLAVLGRLLRLRARGPIDLLVYPIGGPQLVPTIRDLCLLPFMLLASRRLAIHFHAGGIAEYLPRLALPLRLALRALCKRATAGLVMTTFGRSDPESLGIDRVVVVPHTLDDCFDPIPLRRNTSGPARLLYVGHLCPDKGTPSLLHAVAALRTAGLECQLDLVGECLAPYTEDQLQAELNRLGLNSTVERPGVLSGDAKWQRFAAADLFVFPSVAPESFGLVLVEAMMWELPIVATDWRGSREVLGVAPGGICFKPEPDLTVALSSALTAACARRAEWLSWGTINRASYEARFRAESFPDRLSQAIETLAD